MAGVMGRDAGIDDHFSVFVRGDLRVYRGKLFKYPLSCFDPFRLRLLRAVNSDGHRGLITFSPCRQKYDRGKQVVAAER